MKLRLLLVPLTAALVLVGAIGLACGDDEEDTTTPTSTPRIFRTPTPSR